MFRKIISQKKSLGKTLGLTALALSGSLALGPVSADILYTSDFETNDTVISRDSYPPMSNSGNSPTIVGTEKGITPRSGSKMMKSYLNRFTSSTNYRTEAAITDSRKFKNMFERGKEYWVGASVYLPQDWNMNYGGTKKNGTPTEERHAGGIILQFHDRAYLAPGGGVDRDDRDGSWRDGLTLVVRHTKQGFKISNGSFGCRKRPACLSNPNIKNEIKILSKTVPMKLGQWNDFVFHVKFSPNSDGFMKVWTNGKLAYNLQGPNYFNEATDEAYPFFKMGLYQAQYKFKGWSKDVKWNVNERTIYHDNLRIGDANSSFEPTGRNIPPLGKNCSLDADANGIPDALTDGHLFTRYMLGLRGNALTSDVVASNCIRCTAAEIEPFLAQCETSLASDIDGNGTVDGLTDGLLITRYLLGLRNGSLIEKTIASDCTRCTAAEIKRYLDSLRIQTMRR
jgi:hypothetical protein